MPQSILGRQRPEGLVTRERALYVPKNGRNQEIAWGHSRVFILYGGLLKFGGQRVEKLARISKWIAFSKII